MLEDTKKKMEENMAKNGGDPQRKAMDDHRDAEVENLKSLVEDGVKEIKSLKAENAELKGLDDDRRRRFEYALAKKDGIIEYLEKKLITAWNEFKNAQD